LWIGENRSDDPVIAIRRLQAGTVIDCRNAGDFYCQQALDQFQGSAGVGGIAVGPDLRGEFLVDRGTS